MDTHTLHNVHRYRWIHIHYTLYTGIDGYTWIHIHYLAQPTVCQHFSRSAA